MAANDRDDDALEIRHQNKTTPTVVAVVLVAVVSVLFLRDPGGSFEGEPVTTTRPLSEQSTTSEPALSTTAPPTTRASAIDPEFVPLRALAVREDGEVFLLSSRPGSLLHAPTTGLSEAAARSVTHAIATEDLFVVRTGQGEVLRAGADGAFRSAGCCWDGIAPSNEPRHVWALDDGVGAELVDLRTRVVVTQLDFDTGVGGPAVFGLVSLDFDATASWHRPGFDPASVPAPEGRRPRAAGGEIVAFAVDGDGVASAPVEARRLTDGALVRSFDLPGAGPPVIALSTIGDAIAIRRAGDAVVVDVATGAITGDLPARGGPMVAIGQGRFATIVGEDIVESSGRTHSALVAEPLILAVRAE